MRDQVKKRERAKILIEERVLEYHFIHGEYFSSVIESESPRAETSI